VSWFRPPRLSPATTVVLLRLALPVPAAAAAFTAATAVPPAAPRSALSPVEARLDAQLRRMIEARTTQTSSNLVPSTHLWERDGQVHVRVRVDVVTADLLAELDRRGLDRRHTARDRVEGWIPTAKLASLADIDGVRMVHPVLPGRLRATADSALRADVARGTGVDGTGVSLGVISDGAGTLPSSAIPANCSAGSGSEGQAIADIVHTLAPGATIFFSEGISSSQEFIAAISCLQAAGANVLVDDIGFYDEPFFEDGPVAQAERAAVQAGVSCHSAAGNDAQDHYAATFKPTSNSDFHDFAAARPSNNFDEIDVAAGKTLDCVLQWNDPFGASSNDYDLEVYDLTQSPPVLVTDSTNPQTGTQDPFETVSLQNVGRNVGRAGVAIRRVHGDVRDLKLFCFGGQTYQYLTPAGSIIGHPAITEVVAVGAVDLASRDIIEPYSSQGPVEISFPAPESRAKPDVVGIDGVTTDAPAYSPFFGTSAAAPDAAGVAALLLEKNGCSTPAQVQQALVSSAVGLSPSGSRDDVYGAGRIDAASALQALPPPACASGDACTTALCQPGKGCVATPLEGVAGLTCLCNEGLAPAECPQLPDRVASRLRRACRLANRASGKRVSVRRTRALAQQISQALTRAIRSANAAATRGVIDDTCVAALTARLDDARGRAQRLHAAL
jgi:subtilisin family serine protease